MRRLVIIVLVVAALIGVGAVILPALTSDSLHASSQTPAAPHRPAASRNVHTILSKREPGPTLHPVHRVGATTGGSIYVHMSGLPDEVPGEGIHSTGADQSKQPSAVISIPRLNVKASVYEGGIAAGQPTIVNGYAVTHFPFSAQPGEPGNFVIYGHDDIQGSIFRSLGSMEIGDHIYIWQRGHHYVYTVTGGNIVSPQTVSVLNPTSQASMTLISCTPLYVDTQRIVIRAMLGDH